jgi:hypothetical protein
VRLRLVLGTLALLLADGCVSVGTAPPSTSGSADPSSARSEPSPSPTDQPDGPDSLHIDQAGVWKADPDSWSVVLTWDPAPGFEAEHYEVTRNGKTIEENLSATRLVDRDVVPETHYRYEVAAVDAGGTRTASSSVKVDTHAPPAADARLEGRFAMKMHITHQSGLRGGASGFAMLFLYDPACANGACDVTWSRKDRPGSGRLPLAGGTYNGTVHSAFQIRSCHGGTLTETLGLTTKVVEASVIHGEWRATKIEGTLHVSAPASGCVTATIDWTFTGFIQT